MLIRFPHKNLRNSLNNEKIKFIRRHIPLNLYNQQMTDLRLQIEPGIIPTDKDIDLHFDEQIKEIGLQISHKNRTDYKEIFRILNVYLSYPDSTLAQQHRNANRLGQLDLKVQKQRNMRETYIRVENEICNCCGFFVQKQALSNCEQGITDVNGMGSSTVVFFSTFKNIAYLLLVMLFIYSVFAFATNISVANDFKYVNNRNATLDYLSISLGSKANAKDTVGNANTFYVASSWLGVVMLTIWLIFLVFMKKSIKKQENEEKGYTSVSDFSVVIEKMPIGYKKEEVQAMLDEYLIKVAPADIGFKQLKVQKYNQAKPFYFNDEEFNDPQLEEAQERIKAIKEELIEWITERVEQAQFSSTQDYRDLRINQLMEINQRIQIKKQEIIHKIVNKLQEQNEKTTTFVFVTFETVQQRDFFLSYNNNSLLTRIKDIFPCFDKSFHFGLHNQTKQFKDLIIECAPEPQDINWGNIGFDECESLWRKFVTAFATLIMLGISFIIVYGLSTVQKNNSNQRFLSFFISLVISVINLIIIKVIQQMTIFQKLYTNNTYQISLAYKSILAQLLNSIFIPIIVSRYIKDDNIYGEGGLTEDIFILAITNSFFPPLVRLIDPYYIFVYLKYHYYTRPLNKIGLSQYELNFIAEKPQFQLGLEYIYLISNFLFICFFVSLQPIIPVFALIGLFLMYWIQKYALYHKSQRPVPGIDTINFIMHQFIYLGGAAYALGSLTWAVFLPNINFRDSMVANLVAAGLGLLIILFPYEAFVSYKENVNLKKSYSDRRIYFPAQYDRLNPVTKKEGVKEYRQFLLRKKQQIEGLSGPLQEDIAAKLLNLTQNNTHKGNMIHKPIFGTNEAAQVARQLFLNQTRNVLDPKLLKSFLLPQREGDRNLDIYISNFGMMNRNFSQREVDANPNSLIQTNHNPYQPEQQLSASNINYTFADKNKQDNFKNIYKSTLNLGDLGLKSNEEMQKSHHPHHKSGK